MKMNGQSICKCTGDVTGKFIGVAGSGEGKITQTKSKLWQKVSTSIT